MASETSSPISTAHTFIDTHTHLDLTAKRMGITIPAVIEEAVRFAEKANSRYEGCVHVSCSLETLAEIDALLATTTSPSVPINVKVAIGVHPHDGQTWTDAAENDIVAAVQRAPGRVVAIGECGLDYHYMNSPREAQIEAFKSQVALGLRLKLPIVVHTREADDDTLEVLRTLLPPPSPGWPVHIHCFTGSAEFALKLLALSDNLCIGITGAGTFSSAKGLHEAIQAIPLDRLLLETDAPYMAPVPHRGKICHSGMIPLIAQRIAVLKKSDVSTVFSQIRQNTQRVYGF